MTLPQLSGEESRLDGAYTLADSLIERLFHLQRAAARRAQSAVLVAVTVGNAAQIADGLGAEVLGSVTSLVAQRVLAVGYEVELLAVSPLGGVLAVLQCDPQDREIAAQMLLEECSGFVPTASRRLWPVITLGLRVLGDAHPAVALADVRATIFDAVSRFPGSLQWHDPQAGARTDRRSLDLTAELADALADPDSELSLAFQPVVCLSTRQVHAVEALLRWQHSSLGEVAPLEAVRVAESSGLIRPLGAWVLDRALAQGAAWRASGREVVVHVNVSPYQLRATGYADALTDTLRRHGLPAEALLLELTETGLMAGDAEVTATLQQLRRLGVGLGIDDFGTGWSSISQLLHLPVDTVKVDRSLVQGIDRSPADFDLLRTVLAMLATAPVEVVAEGVENAAQAAHLQALGCRLAQGYHLGRPVPAAALRLSRRHLDGASGPRRPGPNGSATAVTPGVA